MCWKCGTKNQISTPVARDRVCEKCGADIRCCKNCCFYKVGEHYDCHETIDEQVLDKEKANFCDYFKYADSQSNSLMQKKAQDAKNAFNALFGD